MWKTTNGLGQPVTWYSEEDLKNIKEVLQESFNLWMFHIANGVGNSSNANVQELLEDFAVAVRLLADVLGESEAFLEYYTNDSKIYKHRKELLKKRLGQ